MAKYNSMSKKAEEFISHEEILKTLKFAEENKDNLDMMKIILEKGKKSRGLRF